MKVTVKLFASFRHGRFVAEDREYPPGITVGGVVGELGIAEQEVGIVLVNSRHAGYDRPLAEGDIVAIFPLLGGG